MRLLDRFYTFGHVKQLKLLRPATLAHGGTLRNTRKGRGARPLSSRETMHLVLRSQNATGTRSFRLPQNAQAIERILAKFAARYGVKILSLANVGNHLHIHLKLASRHTYRPFIRAVTAAIAMAVSGASRWNKLKEKFWDYRPYSRVIVGKRAYLRVRDYLEVNKLEGLGLPRKGAEWVIRRVGELRARYG